MNIDSGFTPIQTKILELLSDGLPHTKDELHACCGPSSRVAVFRHVCALRKKLKRKGQDVVCRSVGSGPMRYQHVRLLVSSEE